MENAMQEEYLHNVVDLQAVLHANPAATMSCLHIAIAVKLLIVCAFLRIGSLGSPDFDDRPGWAWDWAGQQPAW